MEIETEYKVLLQYFGGKIKHNEMGITCDWITLTDKTWDRFKDKSFSLVLRPLSAITDEDAIEVAVLAGMTRPMNRFEFVISRHINYTKRILSEYFEGYKPTEEIITGNVWLSIYQFLQSKGYDFPNYLLGGKNLQEAGLAIYEK